MEAVLLSPLGRLVLESAVVSIGSASDNQLVVNGTKVSSHHAEMRVVEQGYNITDLASTNGTFVNAQQLASNAPHPLNAGDIIRVGNTSFRYEISGVAEQAPTPPVPTSPFGMGVKRILTSTSQQPVTPVSVAPPVPTAPFGMGVKRILTSTSHQSVAPPAPVATSSIPTSSVEQEYQSIPPAPVATSSIPTSSVEQEYQSTPPASVAPVSVATSSIPTSSVEQEYQSIPPASIAPPAIPSSVDAILLGSSGRTVLAFTVVSIGSTTDNQVVLDDAKVSLHHAEMHETEEGYSITDLASKNGTFVNAQRLVSNVPHPLNTGDMIRIGNTHMRYVVNSPATPVAPEPVAPPAIPSFTEGTLLRPSGRTVLKSAVVSIGSTTDNQVVVNDAKVSPHHAEMHLTEEGYSITDLASTNGTFVNAQKLASTVPHPLNSSDMIRIGNTHMRYVVNSPATPVAPALVAPPAPAAVAPPVISSFTEAILLSPSGQTVLSSAVVSIGSAADNQVVVNDSKVSPHHAEIRAVEQGYSISDLASTNGTFVNAQQLASNAAHPLNSSDIIRIGNTPFRYEVSGAAPVAPSEVPSATGEQEYQSASLAASPSAPQQDAPPASVAPSEVPNATGEQEYQSASLAASPSAPQQDAPPASVAPPEVPSGLSAQPKKQSRWGLWVVLTIIAVVALTAIIAVFVISH